MDPYLGEIRIFAGNFAPEGWHFCDGTVLPISSNEALFTVIGTTYGGDGQSTFGLPDLRGRVPVNRGQGNPTNYTLGQTGGTETVTINSSQYPAHSHTFTVSSADGNATSPSNNFLAAPVDTNTSNPKNLAFYLPQTATGLVVQPLPAAVISPAPGGGGPHENRMSYVAVNYIICLAGIFPQSQ